MIIKLPKVLLAQPALLGPWGYDRRERVQDGHLLSDLDIWVIETTNDLGTSSQPALQALAGLEDVDIVGNPIRHAIDNLDDVRRREMDRKNTRSVVVCVMGCNFDERDVRFLKLRVIAFRLLDVLLDGIGVLVDLILARGVYGGCRKHFLDFPGVLHLRRFVLTWLRKTQSSTTTGDMVR